MENYESLKEKTIIVGMDEVDISTEEKPIIGTDSLGPCVGLLLYCPGKKRAAVVHAPADWKHLIPQIFFLLHDNGIITSEQYKNCDEIYIHHKIYHFHTLKFHLLFSLPLYHSLC